MGSSELGLKIEIPQKLSTIAKLLTAVYDHDGVEDFCLDQPGSLKQATVYYIGVHMTC